MKTVDKRRWHSKPRRHKYCQLIEGSQHMEVETILVEQITMRRGVPLVQEYLERWKNLLKRWANWKCEDALGKFMDWIRWFKSELSTGSSMAWVEESVMQPPPPPPPPRSGGKPYIGSKKNLELWGAIL